MTKGDDLWGDQPALGPGSKFGGASASAPADLPASEPSDVPPPTPTRLDIEADRIDGMSKVDLAKKQAFELTAIRLLLERLSNQIEETRGPKGPEPTDAESKTLP